MTDSDLDLAVDSPLDVVALAAYLDRNRGWPGRACPFPHRADHSVIGAPFYVMDFAEEEIYRAVGRAYLAGAGTVA